MQPISKDLNLNDLLGDYLPQIRIGKYDVQFCFGCGCVIQSERKVELINNSETITIFDEKWFNIEPLLNIICEEVIHWAIESEYSFSISFRNGYKIIFYSSDDPYEDIIIRYKDTMDIF